MAHSTDCALADEPQLDLKGTKRQSKRARALPLRRRISIDITGSRNMHFAFILEDTSTARDTVTHKNAFTREVALSESLSTASPWTR